MPATQGWLGTHIDMTAIQGRYLKDLLNDAFLWERRQRALPGKQRQGPLMLLEHSGVSRASPAINPLAVNICPFQQSKLRPRKMSQIIIVVTGMNLWNSQQCASRVFCMCCITCNRQDHWNSNNARQTKALLSFLQSRDSSKVLAELRGRRWLRRESLPVAHAPEEGAKEPCSSHTDGGGFSHDAFEVFKRPCIHVI
jgi:hypothetical protein